MSDAPCPALRPALPLAAVRRRPNQAAGLATPPRCHAPPCHARAAQAGPRAAAAAAAQASGAGEALPLVSETEAELMARPIKELKEILKERRIDASDCFEKGDLARKIVATCTNVTYYK